MPQTLPYGLSYASKKCQFGLSPISRADQPLFPSVKNSLFYDYQNCTSYLHQSLCTSSQMAYSRAYSTTFLLLIARFTIVALGEVERKCDYTEWFDDADLRDILTETMKYELSGLPVFDKSDLLWILARTKIHHDQFYEIRTKYKEK